MWLVRTLFFACMRVIYVTLVSVRGDTPNRDELPTGIVCVDGSTCGTLAAWRTVGSLFVMMHPARAAKATILVHQVDIDDIIVQTSLHANVVYAVVHAIFFFIPGRLITSSTYPVELYGVTLVLSTMSSLNAMMVHDDDTGNYRTVHVIVTTPSTTDFVNTPRKIRF